MKYIKNYSKQDIDFLKKLNEEQKKTMKNYTYYENSNYNLKISHFIEDSEIEEFYWQIDIYNLKTNEAILFLLIHSGEISVEYAITPTKGINMIKELCEKNKLIKELFEKTELIK